MSEALATLLSLCHCLRPAKGSEDVAQLLLSEKQWTAVINLATVQYLAPALWLALKEKDCVDCLPADARAFLQEAHRLNVIRNTKLRQQALELLAALEGAGIKAVLLKGGSYLFDSERRAFEGRMMLDLDLLVSEGQLRESFQVAANLGYRVSQRSDELFQHLDAMVRDGDLASIELHRHVGMQRGLLPPQDVLRHASRLEADGVSVYLPTATQRAIQNIFHSEVQAQNNYLLGHVSVRYLHDLMLLRSRHEAEIDWREVQIRLSRLEYGYLLAGYLYLAHRLLGLCMPVPVTASAQRHYRWCTSQLEWPFLRALVSFWGTLAHPFRRPPVEYLYGEHASPARLTLNRMRYVLYLARTQRTRAFTKLLQVIQRMYSHQ